MTAFEDVRTNWIAKFISIYPLKLIAQDLGVEYKLIEYKDLDQVVAALEKGELDVFTPLAVTASRETVLDLSHPYLASGSAIAVPAVGSGHGLQAIVDGKIDAFVFNELVLKYISKTEFPGRVHVLPETFDHYYVGIAMPQGSPLREPVNRALLKIIDTDDWLGLKDRYIGSGR